MKTMKAVQLRDHSGWEGLRVADVACPVPGPGQVLIQVKASGVNFAELELAYGRYQVPKAPPFTMGFEAAGTVVALGEGVTQLSVGDPVTTIVTSGGFAEYALADAVMAIPIPEGMSFAEATTIPIQGVTAYALLHQAARLQSGESILIQSAAGGVGLYLLQLAKQMGAGKVLALAGSTQKLQLVRELGADVAIDYSAAGWPEKVRQATDGRGVDVVLEAAAGEVGAASFKLLAPSGRMIIYGARNVHDTLTPEHVQQLIYKNQTIRGFNLPSLPPGEVFAAVRGLLGTIREGKIRIFASQVFPLEEVRNAFAAMASRETIGRVVLAP